MSTLTEVVKSTVDKPTAAWLKQTADEQGVSQSLLIRRGILMLKKHEAGRKRTKGGGWL